MALKMASPEELAACYRSLEAAASAKTDARKALNVAERNWNNADKVYRVATEALERALGQRH